MIDSNRLSKSPWERIIRQYAHHEEPLFNTLTSIDALRWVLFVRNIDARGWELHLRDPESSCNQSEYLSHDGSSIEACRAGELDIVKAMVERMQVDVEARGRFGRTPLYFAAHEGNLPVVQYLCELGADKEVRSVYDRAPLHWAASNGHLPLRSTVRARG